MEIDKDILSAGGWPHPYFFVYAVLRVPTIAGRAGRREKRERSEKAKKCDELSARNTPEHSQYLKILVAGHRTAS